IFKRDPSYVEGGNYQVLNAKGNLVKSTSVNWKSLSPNNFPYTIRQSTGCDNALGLIKLQFENPFTIYLHDTPTKILFSTAKRFYSHGCMRLEKAMEVGRYVLKGNTMAIDTLDVKACLKSQSPTTVRASEAIPVFVLYNTVWIDSNGMVRFFEDIYDRKPWLYKSLNK
ncbi:MAG: L,D-transpeptidase family protein, partial [Sediminibacterium sp.]